MAKQLKRIHVKVGPLEVPGARDSLGLFTVYVDINALDGMLSRAAVNNSGKSCMGPFTAHYKQMRTAEAEYLAAHPELLS